MLRSWRENSRTVSMTSGPTASAIRVSFQFRYSIQPSRPATAIESFTSTVSTVVAAPVTPATS